MPGVPEYDAFGREIDDDPLKAFRERAPTPAPAPARDEVAEPARTAPWPDPAPPAPEQPPPPPWIEFVRPRRRRRGGMARLLLALAVLGVGAVALLNVGARVEGGIDDIVDRPPATVEPDGPAATGVAGASLIRRANFANAVATLEDAGLGRPLALRVAPDRIDATLLAKGGRLHQVQITTDGDLRRLASSDAPT